ncbi:MAG: hypothetical protein K2X86_01055 [Cytophagaceae bacterium]|nr:hypothetical protein [Cytophagaceae bacterium]
MNETAKNTLAAKIRDFIEHWDSHGTPVKASWTLNHDRFLIIAVDDQSNDPSGCSIDKSVKFLKEFEAETAISFLERSSLAVFEENQVKTYEIKDLKNTVQQGKITPKTLIFNNLAPTLADLSENWCIPAEKTWLSRFFNN